MHLHGIQGEFRDGEENQIIRLHIFKEIYEFLQNFGAILNDFEIILKNLKHLQMI